MASSGEWAQKSFTVVSLSGYTSCCVAVVCQVRKTSQAAVLMLLEHSLISKGTSYAALAAWAVADVTVIIVHCEQQPLRISCVIFQARNHTGPPNLVLVFTGLKSLYRIYSGGHGEVFRLYLLQTWTDLDGTWNMREGLRCTLTQK